MEMFNTTILNDSQRVIEFNHLFNGRDLVFRFTETRLNDSAIELNVNEIVDKTSGCAEFIWSDDIQNLKLCKLCSYSASENDVIKFAEELIGIGKKFTSIVA